MGLRVPEDVSVTGIDDVDYTTMFYPYLTKAERQFIPYHLALWESAAACKTI